MVRALTTLWLARGGRGWAGVLVLYALVAWFGYLIFLAVICWRHGPSALRDAAEAIKAFPLAGLAAAVARVVGQRGSGE